MTAPALAKYRRLLAIQVRTSLTLGMQYRLDFLIEGAVSIFWVGVTLIPLLVVFGTIAARLVFC